MSHIDTRLEDGILQVAFNRPEKKNAITAEMYSELAEVITTANKNDLVKVVLLTGVGADFTTGNDVGLFVQTGEVPKVSPAMGFMQAIVAFEKPIVASVRGYAVGIGATVLIHCDHVIVADDVKIRFPFVDLGLSPEFGSTLLLRELVGRRRADQWLMLCSIILAPIALDSGFANSVVDVQSLTESAKEVARQYASKPSLALASTRKLLRARHSEDALQRLGVESAMLDQLRQSDEAQAIFHRFLQRSASKKS